MRDELIRDAQLLTRDEYVDRYSYVFFAYGFGGEGGGLQEYRMSYLPPQGRAHLNSLTQIMPITDDNPESKPLPDTILPVTKSERSPYRDRISIGRAAICDMVLAAPAVSKLHAHFLMEPGGAWSVRDARSTNGTFVNGVRLQEEVRVSIRPGDRLRFAYCDGRFLDAGALYDLLASSPPRR